MTGDQQASDFNRTITNRLDVDFALKAAGIGVWEHDPVSGRVQWDDRCAELFGVSNDPQRQLGDTLGFIHPDDVESVNQAIQRALDPASDGSYRMVYRNIGQDGQTRWIQSSGRSEFNKAGQVVRFAGIAQDVTESIRSRQQVEASEDQFRRLLEQAPMAIALFRGPNHIIELANDAHLELWGRTAEQVLNKPLFDALPEARGQGYEELLASVLTTGEPFYGKELSAELIRNGQPETVYFNFLYQALRGGDGSINGVVVMANEITELVTARKQAEAEEHIRRSLIEEATVATALYTGPEHRIAYVNDIMLGYWGRDRSVIGKTIPEALPELSSQNFPELLDRVFKTGVAYQSPDAEAYLMVDGKLKRSFFNFTYKPLFDNEGKVWSVHNMAVDVTEQVLDRQKSEESEARFRNLAESSGVMIALSDETGRITYYNQAWLDFTGWSMDEMMTRGHADLIHPDDLTRLRTNHRQSIERRRMERSEFRMRDHQGDERWFYVQDTPRFTADGTFAGSIASVIDIHERKIAGQLLAESQTRLAGVIAAAPAGIGLFVGRDLIIENPNQTFIDIVGKGPDIVGLPLREAMPELLTEGQPFLKILDNVFTTGVPFLSSASLVKIVQNGVLNDNYYNISYTPLRNDAGEIYAILDIAIDVTEQVKAQQSLAESKAILQNAVELAELGTWSIDLSTGITTLSSKYVGMFGLLDEQINLEQLYSFTHIADRQRVIDTFQAALQPDSDGRYDVEYRAVDQRSGNEFIIHALGQVISDDGGKPIRVSGIAQDVTLERERKLALENEVQLRTEELAAANEELAAANEEMAATNEEMAASNEELTESTDLLLRSNENLQKFAYVASHDLQEPLRKIQQFGDILKNQYRDQLGAGTDYLERMQASASRMSTLIRDLLNYSRISTQRDSQQPVNLNRVVEMSLADLELVIDQTGAQIEVGSLPMIQGDALQLGQLFQNLLSNALKFSRTDRTGAPKRPHINVRTERVTAVDLPISVKPTRSASAYYRIDVADNGIGFDEKYLDRIFEVFQRLHGKQEYVGTGIGLAICEKVVVNHGGAITATSQPGQGATFSVYLPD